MFIGLIASILVVVIGLLDALIDHRWRDRRTNAYRRTRWLLLTSFLALGIFTVLNVYQSHHDSADLTRQVTGLHNDLAAARQEAMEQAQAATEERATGQRKLDELKTSLAQLFQEARRRYPGLPDDEALQRLSDEIVKVRELAAIDIHRPMSEESLGRVTRSLSEIRGRFAALKPGYMISTASGSRNQGLASAELSKAFRQAGYWFAGGGTSARYPPPSQALLVDFHPSEQPYGEAVAQALSRLFMVSVAKASDSHLTSGVVRIVIQGEPVFTRSGLETFR